jgi:hypothetical protein
MITLMESGMTKEQALQAVEQSIKDTPAIIALAHGINLVDYNAMLDGIPNNIRSNITYQGSLICSTESGGADCFDPGIDPVKAAYVLTLHRMPEEGGYEYWKSQYEAGAITMDQMTAEMRASPEGVAYYQSLDTRVKAEGVLATYIQETNGLPSDAEFQYRLQQLEAGMTMDQVKQSIAEDTP